MLTKNYPNTCAVRDPLLNDRCFMTVNIKPHKTAYACTDLVSCTELLDGRRVRVA